LKITTQLVAMVGIIVLGMVGMVLGLAVWADWSDGAIVGMVSGFGTLATGLIMAVRNQQKTTETLEAQDVKLDTVMAQTNGMSEIEREAIADAAADKAAVAVVKAWREGKL
jgi:hypothetical protein